MSARAQRIAVGAGAVGTPAGVASAINRVQDNLLAALARLSAVAAVSPLTPAGEPQAGTLHMGAGAPDGALGRDGDHYLRTGTPGVANQRHYVKSAGAWVGIS